MLYKKTNHLYLNFYLKLLNFLELKRIDSELKKLKTKEIKDIANKVLHKQASFNAISYYFILDTFLKNKSFFVKFYLFMFKQLLNSNKKKLKQITLKVGKQKKLILGIKNVNLKLNKDLLKVYYKICNFFLFINRKILNNTVFLARRKKINIKYSTRQKKYIIRKLNTFNIQKKLILNVTFKKKNTFFNVSDFFGKTIFCTSIRKEGYIGRKRVEYNSIFSVTRLVREIILNYFEVKNHSLSVIYKG